MLLNVSNHPSEKWLPKQKQQALDKWEKIQDLSFPSIPPEASDVEIVELAEEYMDKIKELAPAAVHLMGEMTFTATLAAKLQQEGIPCYASTTRRIAIEEGNKKMSVFEFVKFRKYPILCE